ncbi:MAG: Gfo/Idh/MocA family oxidoreductase [Lentisphaeria bacterium]|nr:Gfo/Idh/MocA family oxidoreductase [Lentisphaeria bacterium]
MRTWRVAVIDHYRNRSRGGHGTHVAFAGLPNVEIVAAADPDEESRQATRHETGAPRSYADWGELLDRENPDIVCVCSRLPTQHLDVVVGAAEAGCHVYCEKPLAVSLADADRMIEAADTVGVRLAVAHLGRYAAVFQALRELIRSGGIGRPLSVFCRGKEDERGGGEDMLVLGSHLLDLARLFFGDPQWVFGHVTVEGRDFTRADTCDPTEPVGCVGGDGITALYGFADGVRGQFESRRGLYEGGEPRMGITVVGSEATLSVRFDNDRRLRLRRSRRPMEEGGPFEIIPTSPQPAPPGAEPLHATTGAQGYFARNNRQAALDLLDAIAEWRDPLASGRDARWSLEMIHGVYVSHLERRAVPLPLIDRRHPLEKNAAAE